MSAEEPGGERTADIQAVTRAGQILALFGPQTPELTAAEIGTRLGLNRTTAYRYCVSLVGAGMLERGSESTTYMLGGLMVQLGTFALSQRRVLDVAAPHLTELTARAHLTAVLSLLGPSGPLVTLVEEDPRRTITVTVRQGTQLGVTSAQTKVFLALHSDQTSMSRLLDGLSVDDRSRLDVQLEQVRSTGFAHNVGADGLLAIAAPVFDVYGVCATIALLGTDKTISLSDDSIEIALLKETAERVTKEMTNRSA